ncbi:MAG: FecR family protein [Candidatus Aceula meridiana]|nr:FecR family protein [Candidatus Aceula meridiana]
MRRLILLIVLILLPTFAFAGEYQVIETKGEVFLRSSETARWRNAHKGDGLSDGYSLKTEKKSECTIGFGEKISRVFTLKENSQITISDLLEKSFLLSRGRLFLFIEKMDAGETFEVKTPTAIAGVRGTGWTVESDDATDVKCFEGEVYVKGLDKRGNITTVDRSIKEGLGIKVAKEGVVGKDFFLLYQDKREWNNFKDVVKDLIGRPLGEAAKIFGGFSDGAVDAIVGRETDAENPFGR